MAIQRLWQKFFPWILVLWCIVGIILHFSFWAFLAGLGGWVLLLLITVPGLFWTYAYFLPFSHQNVTLLQKAVAAKPLIPNPYFIMGVFLAKQQKYDQAIPLLENALQYASGRPALKIKTNLAVIYRENGAYQKTIDLLNQLINQGVKTYPVYSNLAVTYLRMNNLPRAMAAARKARSFNVKAIEPVLVMGRIHFLMGDFAAARDDYEWAVSHTSWPVESYYWLARTEFELGEIEAAETHFKTAVERITEDPHLSDVPVTEAESWLLKVQNSKSNN
jgi:tetratricopeptide (TPR) repeat protein